MSSSSQAKRSPFLFFGCLVALSLPFWLLSAFTQPPAWLPIKLPVSSLIFCCPFIAACILVYRAEGWAGVRGLLRRIFDWRKIKPILWYLPIIGLNPLIMLLAYGVMRLLGLPLPEPLSIPFLTLPLFFVVFFLTAIGEEVGWTGYALDPLQERWGALRASLLLGIVWALWHVVGYKQDHQWAWVAGQCLSTVSLRVLMVWLSNNTGKSLLSVILFHTMINVSEFSFPNYGSHYDPVIAGTLTAVLALIVICFWDPKTLARFRHASPGSVPESPKL